MEEKLFSWKFFFVKYERKFSHFLRRFWFAGNPIVEKNIMIHLIPMRHFFRNCAKVFRNEINIFRVVTKITQNCGNRNPMSKDFFTGQSHKTHDCNF